MSESPVTTGKVLELFVEAEDDVRKKYHNIISNRKNYYNMISNNPDINVGSKLEHSRK